MRQTNKLCQTSKLEKTSFDRDDLERVIHAFSTRLDYCNTLYTFVNQFSLSRLQLVPNDAARFLM